MHAAKWMVIKPFFSLSLYQLLIVSLYLARRRRSVENCTTINNDMSLPPSNQGTFFDRDIFLYLT